MWYSYYMNLYDTYKDTFTHATQTILGREVPTLHGTLPVDSVELSYWSRNPRLLIPSAESQAPTQEQLHNILKEQHNIVSLMKGIDHTGGLNTPVEVTSGGIVFEGNRSLCAARERFHLKEDTRFSTVRVIIYDTSLTEEEMFTRAGLTNNDKKKWPKMESALFALQQVETYNLTLEQLAARYSWTHQNAKGYVEGAKMVRRYYDWAEEYPKKWTPFYKFAIDYKLTTQASVDDELLPWFFTLVKNNRLGDNREFPNLLDIYGDKKATAIIEDVSAKGGIAAATRYLEAKRKVNSPEILDQALVWVETINSDSSMTRKLAKPESEEARVKIHNLRLMLGKLLDKIAPPLAMSAAFEEQ